MSCHKLRAGQVVGCTKLNLGDPRVADPRGGSCGIDCIWLDREHVANDLRDIEAMIGARQGLRRRRVGPRAAGQL